MAPSHQADEELVDRGFLTEDDLGDGRSGALKKLDLRLQDAGAGYGGFSRVHGLL